MNNIMDEFQDFSTKAIFPLKCKFTLLFLMEMIFHSRDSLLGSSLLVITDIVPFSSQIQLVATLILLFTSVCFAFIFIK